jgi:hypothetical protein
VANKDALRRYRERNPEKVTRFRREWGERNKELIANYTRTYNLKRKGFTVESYAFARSIQGEACGLCKTLFNELDQRKIHADHDHATNQPRGVLCHYCNVGLGVFKDSPTFLTAAIQYLNNPPIMEYQMIETTMEDLKETLAQNTAAIRELIKALATGVPTTQKQVEAVIAQAPAKPVETETEEIFGKKATPEVVAQVQAPKEVTYQEAAAAVLALSKEKGRAPALAVLEQFKAVNLKEIAPDQYGAVLVAATLALAA